MIFRTDEDLKKYVGGAVNKDLPLSVLTAAYRDARRQHIDRYLGAAFLNELEGAVAGANITDVQQRAVDWIGPALAMLTLYEYSFVASVQMGGEGLVTIEGERAKSAYKYQVKDYRDATLASGLTALDICLENLEAHAADYPTWSLGKGARYHRAVLIRTAAEFRDIHNQATDRRAYEAMRPLLKDLHLFVAESVMGSSMVNILLESQTNDNATEAEANLIRHLQRALAAFTVHEALRRNLVNLKGGRVVQYEALEPQSTEREGTPSSASISTASWQNSEFAERYLGYVRDYLRANAAHFPEYVEWLALSQAAADPNDYRPHSITRRRGARVIKF